jgi:DNA-directed RNA polymerase sigma subunit (sigma70/sigma32)
LLRLRRQLLGRDERRPPREQNRYELILTRERVRQLEAQALARLSALRELSSVAVR